MKNIFIALTIIFTISVEAETYTQAREISEIDLRQYKSSSTPAMTYFNIYSTTGSWDPLGCAQQSIVTFKSNETTGYEQFLSMALSAKMAKRKVAFNGECINDTSFVATSIKIW